MKNIIIDQKYVVLGIVARSSSLPANQNSKIKIQKSLGPLINTLLQQGGAALPGPSTVSTVCLAWAGGSAARAARGDSATDEISNLKSAISHDLALNDLAASRFNLFNLFNPFNLGCSSAALG